MKAIVHKSYEGGYTCEQVEQVILGVSQFYDTAGNVWSCLQNNNNNEYYLDLVGGSYTNNNKNNQWNVVPVESEDLADLVYNAEEDCWKNKHSSWDACKYHYHQGKRIEQLRSSLEDGTYEPWKSLCFTILHPLPREIFAAHYQDRIAHHIVAPYMSYIANCAHEANGNMSFGNRKGLSAAHACERLQQLMRKHPDGIVVTFDIQGFFMSIDKATMWAVFQYYESKYRPDIPEPMRALMMWLIHKMIFHDPSQNCQIRSPEDLRSLVPPHKSLFGHPDRGLPIGNFYAQILANLLLAILCEILSMYDSVEFVDDFAAVCSDISEWYEIRGKRDRILQFLKLKAHIRKLYIQPVRHGVRNWCGRSIYPDSIRLADRQIRNCLRAIQTARLEDYERLMQTVNSHTGSMSRCNEYHLQQRIRDILIERGFDSVYDFVEKPNHIVVNIKKEKKRGYRSKSNLKQFEIELYNLKHRKSMIIMPVKKSAKHFERTGINEFTYRYGYAPIPEDSENVSACVEVFPRRLKKEAIQVRVETYCREHGLPNEFKPEDYGY